VTRIAVVVPVGPLDHHQHYLRDCLSSIRAQSRAADVVVLVDDMADFSSSWSRLLSSDTDVVRYEAPWRLGVAAAFNAGVATAFSEGADLAVMLGADDSLMPDALEAIEARFEETDRATGYYWMGVRYSDGREDQFLPCHAAAVTPRLWQFTGGFSPAMGLWAPDAAFVSVLLVHAPELLIGVAIDREADGRSLYWHRIHEAQETADGVFWAQSGIGNAIRNHLTGSFKPAEGWGRYR